MVVPSAVVQGSQSTLSNAMTLHVCNDEIAFTIVLLEINCSDLDEPLELIADENVARY